SSFWERFLATSEARSTVGRFSGLWSPPTGPTSAAETSQYQRVGTAAPGVRIHQNLSRRLRLQSSGHQRQAACGGVGAEDGRQRDPGYPGTDRLGRVAFRCVACRTAARMKQHLSELDGPSLVQP